MNPMAKSDGERTPGWYPIDDDDPARPVRYWDGTDWRERPAKVPPSRDVIETERRVRLEEMVRSTGAREGEGIPFHELYLRRRNTKKGNFFG